METTKRVWFVTGASKGFGLELVKLLLSSGNKVAATSRNIVDLEKQVGATDENFLALKVDITNDKEVKDAIKQTVETFGQLDVLVNNAGYAIYGGEANPPLHLLLGPDAYQIRVEKPGQMQTSWKHGKAAAALPPYGSPQNNTQSCFF